ncbi:MAG: glycosyltransferase family 9 protein, partial [Rhizomicrobium sp.]
WRLYEWRKKRFSPEVSRDYPQPVWLGEEDIEGKTLFVYAEQGLGDTIQFCRYAQLAEVKGANVIFAVQDELIPLLGKLTDGITIMGWKAPPPPFDLQTSLLSMPLAFGTDENNIPATVPYLQPGPDLVAKWRKFLGNDGYRVGICWQGKKDTPIDKGRSFPLRCLEGLSKIPNLRLISLQKNDGVEQLRGLPPGMKVETLGENFDAGPGAFVDTAAVMESLDLVVTTDTAIAHLAGALARPVWVALKHVPEWRWLLGRADSPWYPTMKLFQQPTDDDWRSVFAAMETELAKLA